jgi:2-polyprenyl-3-methyl-5-hydroxy-6-metoxy-1,4-benzoquinol methylase
MSLSTKIVYDRQYIQAKGWGTDTFGIVSNDDATVLCAELSQHFQKGDRLLELGFGNGGVASWCRTNDVQWVGVEVNPDLVAAARANGYEAYASVDEVPADQPFTGAVAFDVLEHIDNSQTVSWLASIAERISPDGLMLLRFPNGDSPFGRIAQNADPTHINAIGRGKLMHYCSASGWEISCLRAPIIPVAKVGLTRGIKRRLIVCARHVIAQLCRVIFFGGVLIPLDSNYLAVLRKAECRR